MSAACIANTYYFMCTSVTCTSGIRVPGLVYSGVPPCAAGSYAVFASEADFNTVAAGSDAGINITQDSTISALATDLSGVKSAVITLQGSTGGVSSSTPNPEIIQAEGVIFAATLAALCAVYGLKRIYRMFVPVGEVGHE